jgi:hypothetical protein
VIFPDQSSVTETARLLDQTHILYLIPDDPGNYFFAFIFRT